jgi:hypothetical protein
MALNLENKMNSRKRNEPIKHYEPFALDDDFKKKPTEFEIDFISKQTRYRFSFGYDRKKIHYEKLEFLKENSANDNFKLIYHLQFDKNDQLITNFTNEFQGNKDKALEILQNTHNNLFLFLNVNEDGNKFLNPIYDWIANKLNIFFDHDNFEMTREWMIEDPKNKKLTIDLIKKFDLGIKDIKFEEIDIPKKFFEDPKVPEEIKEKVGFNDVKLLFWFENLNIDDEYKIHEKIKKLYEHEGEWYKFNNIDEITTIISNDFNGINKMPSEEDYNNAIKWSEKYKSRLKNELTKV